MLYRERLPARQGNAELVLLHGWGASSDCWRSALPQLRRQFNVTLIDLPGHGRSQSHRVFSVDEFITDILTHAPARAIYLGWSLGGMIATRITAQFPERVSALITAAANPSFVQREDWLDAMPVATYEDFVERFASNPTRGLRRFDALQGALTPSVPGEAETQLQLLGWLSELDNRDCVVALDVPMLAVFGADDGLVPGGAAQAVARLNSSVEVCEFKHSGHLPFVTESAAFWQTVLDFCQRYGAESSEITHYLNKRQVAESFSRAANSYDSVADLQRRVADQLATRLPPESGRALDLGSGTGYSLPALNAVTRSVVAIDLAEGMLAYARSQADRQAEHWVCADAEDLPLADDSVDLVFSSLAVQWCENIAAVFAEAYRVLKPGGKFLVSTLGPETLFELREAGRAADDATHVNRFLPRADLEDGITRSGLQLVEWQEVDEVLEYDTLRELMAELKRLGAHNVNRDRGMMGKQALRRFIAAYESYRQANGLLPATYQVWYLTLTKPLA